MRKFLGIMLAILVASGASVQNAAAYNRRADKFDRYATYVAAVEVQPDGLPSDLPLGVMSEDNRQAESEHVAKSEAVFTPSSKLATVNHSEPGDVAGDPNPQGTPRGTQSPPTHHSHHLREAIIIVAVVIGMAIALAAAAK